MCRTAAGGGSPRQAREITAHVINGLRHPPITAPMFAASADGLYGNICERVNITDIPRPRRARKKPSRRPVLSITIPTTAGISRIGWKIAGMFPVTKLKMSTITDAQKTMIHHARAPPDKCILSLFLPVIMCASIAASMKNPALTSWKKINCNT